MGAFLYVHLTGYGLSRMIFTGYPRARHFAETNSKPRKVLETYRPLHYPGAVPGRIVRVPSAFALISR